MLFDLWGPLSHNRRPWRVFLSAVALAAICASLGCAGEGIDHGSGSEDADVESLDATADASMSSAKGYDQYTLSRQILKRVNEYRRKGAYCYDATVKRKVWNRPVRALTMSTSLTWLASKRSEEQAKKSEMLHNTEWLWSMLSGWGVKFGSLGETLAESASRDPEDRVDGWMSSEVGHCQTLMGSVFNSAGGWYAVDSLGFAFWTLVLLEQR